MLKLNMNIFCVLRLKNVSLFVLINVKVRYNLFLTGQESCLKLNSSEGVTSEP